MGAPGIDIVLQFLCFFPAGFARVYAAREKCSSSKAARVASIVCESLSLMAPLEAVATVFSDGDLLMALRIATREAPGNSHIPDPLSQFMVVATAA